MSFLLLTIPITLIVSAVLLLLVIRATREGQYDDWNGPAWRMLHDDDTTPETEAAHDAVHEEDLPSSPTDESPEAPVNEEGTSLR